MDFGAPDLIYGIMYGMSQKTTVYLPDQLKARIEAAARRKRCSEAQIIRDALERGVERPRPRSGILAGEPFADRADELLAGFGER